MSDIIRNPNRSIRKQQVPYETEYARKNIVPEKAPVSNIFMPTPAPSLPEREEYASMDNEIYDDDGSQLPIQDDMLIDNNDFVNIPGVKIESQVGVANVESLKEDPAPKVGDYILMVFEKLILSGSINSIETKVKSIMYGEDPDFQGMEISLDDIIVLKRVDIKIGIFING